MDRFATIGLIAGLLLAVAAAIGGWGALVLAVVLGAAGLVAGLQADGVIDLRAVARSRSRG